MEPSASKTYISSRKLEQYAQAKQLVATQKTALSIGRTYQEDSKAGHLRVQQLPVIEEVKRPLRNAKDPRPTSKAANALVPHIRAKSHAKTQAPHHLTQTRENRPQAKHASAVVGKQTKQVSFSQQQQQQQQHAAAESTQSSTHSVAKTYTSCGDENYEDLSCEEVFSDDFDSELDPSGDQLDLLATIYPGATNKRRKKPKASGSSYSVEFDTNVFKVSLEGLEQGAKRSKDESRVCTGCKAIYNQGSRVVQQNGMSLWKCEFCDKLNKLKLTPEQQPPSNDVTYKLKNAAQTAAAALGTASQPAAQQDISVIFCIDTSDSMSIDDRLEMCKHAVKDQIRAMAANNPGRKVGLVSFDDIVKVFGDGVEKPVRLADEYLLEDFKFIHKFGLEMGDNSLKRPISKTQKALLSRVRSMECDGITSLGPAVLTSVAMASKGAPGSQVIVLTDGMANKGIGCFQETPYGYNDDIVAHFYKKVGSLARDSGVSVNLVTIDGTDANIDGLQSLVELSGGQISIVEPFTIQDDFSSILSATTTATRVDVSVKLHKALQFRNELDSDLSDDKTMLTRQFGNVTSDTMFFFDYGLKPVAELVKMRDVDMAAVHRLPFQTQVKYTNLEGERCLRVITRYMEVSHDKAALKASADAAIIEQNFTMQSSKQARAGNMRQAQALMKVFMRESEQVKARSWQTQRRIFSEKNSQVYTALNSMVQEQAMLSAPKTTHGRAAGSFCEVPGQPAGCKTSVRMDDKTTSMVYNLASSSVRRR